MSCIGSVREEIFGNSHRGREKKKYMEGVDGRIWTNHLGIQKGD